VDEAKFEQTARQEFAFFRERLDAVL